MLELKGLLSDQLSLIILISEHRINYEGDETALHFDEVWWKGGNNKSGRTGVWEPTAAFQIELALSSPLRRRSVSANKNRKGLGKERLQIGDWRSYDSATPDPLRCTTGYLITWC